MEVLREKDNADTEELEEPVEVVVDIEENAEIIKPKEEGTSQPNTKPKKNSRKIIPRRTGKTRLNFQEWHQNLNKAEQEHTTVAKKIHPSIA